MVNQELEQWKIKRINESQNIKIGIKQLEENKKVVIRPADKGGAIVVLSKEYYNKELSDQLCDTNTYIKLKGTQQKNIKMN